MKKIYIQPETMVVKMATNGQVLTTSNVDTDSTPVSPSNSDAPSLDIPSSVFEI